MPVVFDDATITRFSNDGENQFASATSCIVDRVSLAIVSGTANYTLPESCINIRRVTWRGKWMEPMPHRDYRERGFPFTSLGEPTSYIYNNILRQTIQFFPTPNETIAAATTNLYGSSIGTSVIVEYARTPDYYTFIIPSYFRRYLLKTFVLKMCFAIESKGTNIKASKYWDAKWKKIANDYALILDDLHNQPRKLLASTYTVLKPRPPRPVLPASFGTYVE